MTSRIVGQLLAGAALFAAAPAFAQAAGDQQQSGATTDPVEQASTNPADIVVTAQRREERLQDVPLAVTVVSGEALAAANVNTIENAQYLVPTLNFRKSGTSINQSLFLRGVGTSTFSIAGEPSVSSVVDGVVFSRAGEAFSDLVDIERLEVLRGPQGTLFGKNASAGVVNITTKRPGEKFGGYVEAGYFTGNGDEYRTRVALDVPLGPDVRSRITGFASDWDGNIRNTTLGLRVNGFERWGFRGVVEADVPNDVRFTLIGDYREANDDCCGELIGTTPSNAVIAQVLPVARGDRTRELAQNLVTATEEKSWGVSFQAEASLGRNTITSITSYREFDNREIRDGDFLPRAFVGFNELHDDGPQVSDTFTQEVRLTSPGDQFLTYTLGAFYSRAYTERTFSRFDIVCAGGAAGTPCTAPGLTVTTPSGTANFGSVFKNLAFYGQTELNLTDQLRLIGGLRYTNDELSVFHSRVATGLARNAAGVPQAAPGIQPNFDQGVFDRYLQLVAAGVAPGAAAGQATVASNGIPFRAKTTNDNWSGKAGVQYEFSPEATAYASWTRGYKGPAFNVFFNLNATGTNVIEPETADSYEAGLKTTLFDGRLVLNVAGFYAKYKNFQANNPDEVAGVIVTRFTNAGTISTRGAELDLLFRPVDDLSISGGLAYTDAKVDRFRVPSNGNNTGVIPSGTRLAYAPEWKASLAADYRIRTGGGLDIGLGGDAAYQSEQLSQFDANPAVREATTIEGYTLVNLAASLIDAADRFRLTAQVRNVFDKSFAASITAGGPAGGYRYIIPREADRYYGITGRVNF
ncbi:TonB-dependent receptor [Sphingomonas lenta]|uniref:TonB-dependent receptor n=1 Tax=Sphingomonas lenta TaxID=1141887 RepID=A0A2A2SCP0_9SPHN|nr:TonB-dependent receptor [Sphingomonas lenta]PAX07027.1 TonB-dependent receptor [Sphingomonas lenta]